ncbi:MAG: hypothetical protein NTV54_02660 [Ignavibacteriales bacterium]|nr:hypothetical protein [Ignavibacteriales bacterium]
MKRMIRTVLAGMMALTMISFLQLQAASSQTKSFKATKGGALSVSVSGGDVTIVPWDKDEVFMKVDGIDSDDVKDLEMSQSGNTVTLKFESHWSHSSDMRFEVSVPRQFDVSLRTAGGDIRFTGSLAGKVHASTAGGNIDVKGIDGPVTLKTSGGNIEAENMSGQTTIKTSGGNIELGTLGAEAEVATSGGNISVKSAGKSLKVNTSGGNISIGDVGGELKASTAGGNVEVRNVSGGATLKTSGGDVSLQSASGAVVARTSGGNIELEHVAGTADAKTSGGDVKAGIIPRGDGRSSLTSSGGSLELLIPSNASATIEAKITLRGNWFQRDDKYDVTSDFPATEKKNEKGEHLIYAKYVLNGGGEKIFLETTNGNISIKKMAGK